MNKRIAFFTCQIYMDYQSKLYNGIVKAAAESDDYVDTFSNFGIYTENYLHTQGEQNIINLPDLSLYDGILISPDTMAITDIMDKLRSLLKNVKCPIVSIRSEEDEYTNLLISNENAMKSVVEHFIEVHNCRNIAYMSGTLGMRDAAERLEGYKKAMAEHGLPINDHMIFHGNYWYGKEKEALDWFLADGQLPDAIVCANDYMALSLCSELEKRGYKIPDDIKISGYDSVYQAKFHVPPLATVDTNGEAMGYEAFNLLRKLINGETVEHNNYILPKPCFLGTCGCFSLKILEENAFAAYSRSSYMENSIYASLRSISSFEKSENIDDILIHALKYLDEVEYNNFHICLCIDSDIEDSTFMGEYTEQCRVALTCTKGGHPTIVNDTFDRSEIIPAKYRTTHNPIITFPLHFRGHCMGYLAIDTYNASSIKEGFILWANTLSNYLDRMFNYERNRKLLKYREESLFDPLTNIYNRRGIDNVIQRFSNESDKGRDFYIAIMDIDELKQINDVYGHQEGDKAIKALSQTILEVSSEEVVGGRFGGDEFIVCILGDENKVLKVIGNIESRISAINNFGGNEFELSASIGYSKFSSRIGLVQCINKADSQMYENKQRRKQERRLIEQMLE